MHNIGYAAVWLLVLFIPLENAIIIQGIGTIGRMVGILALLTSTFVILFQNTRIRLHPVHGLMLVFVLLSGASFFWSIDPENTLKRIFTYFQNLVMMWLIYQWCDDEKKVQGLFLAFLFGSIGLAFGVIEQFQKIGMAARVEAYNFNPNEIASILALSIPFAWYLFLVKKGPVRWICFLVLPVVAFSMLLTGSRAGFIKGLLGVMFILMTPPPRVGRVWGLVLIGVAIGTIATVVQYIPGNTWGRLLTTHAELSSGSLGGRAEIWSAGVKVFSNDPVWGVGAGAFGSTMTSFFTTARAPHSVLAAILVEQGVIGLGAFGAIALTVARSTFRQFGIELRLWITVLGIWGATILTSNWEWRKQMWLILILAVTHAVVRMPVKTVLSEKSVPAVSPCAGLS